VFRYAVLTCCKNDVSSKLSWLT